MDVDSGTAIIIGIVIVVIFIIIYEVINHIQVNEIPKITQPSITKITNNFSVPKIIHRTWYSRSLSKKMYDSAYLSWIRLNPDYTMIWNNDEDCEQFMKEFGEHEYNAWKRIIPTAYKADFWRAVTIWLFGGIYVDSYAVSVKSIDEIILRSGLQNEKDIFISVLDSELSNSGIHNGFIICTPKHPIIKQYIEDILINIELGKEDEIMSLTGPICLSRSINKYLERDINIKHKVGLNIINNKKFYLLQFHWGPSGNITINNEVMLYKKYDVIDCWLYQKIYKSLISSKQSYSAMNSIGMVVRPK